jgi:hypothetical protein
MKLLLTFLLSFSVFLNSKAQDLNPKDWSHLKGYWKFQDPKNLTKATVGNNLTLSGTHASVAGAAYGDTAVRIGLGSYYRYSHNIAPNGGGDSVNQYTLMFDFKVLNFNRWHTFYQTDTSNKNDGECFIRPNTGTNPGGIGTATTGYTTTPINAKQWYRLVVSVNLNHFYRFYLNGKLILEGDTQEVDGRFALLPQILFFADNNQEDDTIDIASLALFDTCLSSADIAKIGTIEPCIANPPKVKLGNDTVLCYNSSLSLSGGANRIKYQWSTGDQMPFALVSGQFLGLGTKSVWVKVTDQNGCIGGDTINITVLDLPKLNLGNDTAICLGQKIRLTAGTDLSHQYSWQHFPSGKTISNAAFITVDSAGKYLATVTSKVGCINIDSVTVSVNKNPGKPKITVLGKSKVCAGDSVQLSGPTGFASYLWTNASKTPAISVKKSETLKLKVKDLNGCESAYSDSVICTVFALPPKPILQIKGDTVFCEGDSIVLIAPAGYAAYLWRDGPGSFTKVVKQSDWNFVIVTDSNGCYSKVSNMVTLSLKAAPAKPTSTISGKTSFCDGGSVMLNGPDDFDAYHWSDSSKTKAITVKKAGRYSLKVRNSLGCYSPWSSPDSITVFPIPLKPQIIAGLADSLKCNTVAQSYKWYRNGVELTETTRSVYFQKSGYFKVMIANFGCWSALSDSFYYKNLAVKGINKSVFKLITSPNPVIQNVVVGSSENSSISGQGYLVLKDVNGKTIQTQALSLSDLKTGVTINMHNLSGGIYWLTILGNGFNESLRLLKL